MDEPDTAEKDLNETERKQFEELLVYLKRNRGFDFVGYKRATLVRRVLKRMETVGITGFDRYMDYLQVHPEEFALLFNHLLINVTSFFRDEQAWAFLNDHVIAKLLDDKGRDDMIRVWSAGCATGQEPYGLAMLLCERLGVSAFHQRVKIYASDIDEDALADARQGIYAPKDVQTVPKHLLDTYFEPMGQRLLIKPDLRRGIIFGRHDLVADAPISRLDLLLCRNTLMYFNAEIQNRILARFHFALNDEGYLFLGKAEMLLTHADLFSALDLRYRVFKKVTKIALRDRLHVMNQMADEDTGGRLTRQLRVRDLALESIPLPQISLDAEGNVVAVNDHARSLFGVTARDLGKPFRDLEVSYRPIELRGPIEQAYAEGKPIRLNNVERPSPNGLVHYDVDIIPLLENGGTAVGVSITFLDVSKNLQLQGEVQRAKQELETAYEELQSTNEELETTNEELQSTVEELETTNEELQSTNEELETMNEELQSTNEELQTVNGELQDRTGDLQQANLFQRAILASLRSGVVVLDERLDVMIWNHETEEMWGLRGEEVRGKSFMSLDIGLPTDELRTRIMRALEGDHQTVDVAAVNRRGKPMTCRVTCSPLREDDGAIHGVIVFMEDIDQTKIALKHDV
jgi:two-component system, chemotaxis family, CheB/CheR fusion protein